MINLLFNNLKCDFPEKMKKIEQNETRPMQYQEVFDKIRLINILNETDETILFIIIINTQFLIDIVSVRIVLIVVIISNMTNNEKSIFTFNYLN